MTSLRGIDHHAGDRTYLIYGDAVPGVAFAGLFLAIIADSTKNLSAGRLLNTCCHGFETLSVFVLGVLIFIR